MSRPPSNIGHMTVEEGQHVFISYVREDKENVDRLCEMLKAAQIPYWRDLKSLEPGDDWKRKIRGAIRNNALVFLACFSDSSRSRPKNNMNEELNLAVEEIRKMPPGETWIIPIRFDEGDVPDWELGPNRSLNDINRVDLFGESYAENIVALTSKINKLMGANDNAATTRAFVEESQAQDRPKLLQQLTKEMIVNPSKRIELDDLIRDELRNILDFLNDENRYSSQINSGTDDERVRNLIALGNDTWEVVRPFCYSLAVAARWGNNDTLSPWVSGIKSIVSAAHKMRPGYEIVNNARHIAAVAVVSVAALACTADSRWENFKTLLADPRVSDNYNLGSTEGLLTATGYWKPFSSGQALESIFAITEETGDDPVELFEQFKKGRGKRHTPIADWIHSVIKPIFQYTGEEYDHNYHRSELMLGIVGQDIAIQDVQNRNQDMEYARSTWFGRSTWNYRYASVSPVEQMASELNRDGSLWPPVQGGLFGGDVDRAAQAINAYSSEYQYFSQRHF